MVSIDFHLFGYSYNIWVRPLSPKSCSRTPSCCGNQSSCHNKQSSSPSNVSWRVSWRTASPSSTSGANQMSPFPLHRPQKPPPTKHHARTSSIASNISRRHSRPRCKSMLKPKMAEATSPKNSMKAWMKIYRTRRQPSRNSPLKLVSRKAPRGSREIRAKAPSNENPERRLPCSAGRKASFSKLPTSQSSSRCRRILQRPRRDAGIELRNNPTPSVQNIWNMP